VLDRAGLADLELIATGATSPLTGFLGRADCQTVMERMRLTDGTFWPWPLTLRLSDAERQALAPGTVAALVDGAGRPRGLIEVSDVFLSDAAHGQSPGGWRVGGAIWALPPEADPAVGELALTPAALRAELSARGWSTVAALHAVSPAHRGHEHLLKLALEQCDGVVLHPTVDGAPDDPVPAALRFHSYARMIERYCPKDRVLLAALPLNLAGRGPRELLFQAVLRQNFGASHIVIARDTGGGPGTAASFEELAIQPMTFGTVFFCPTCGELTSANACPHEALRRLEVSNARIRSFVAKQQPLPVELMRPEIAELLGIRHFGETALPAARASRGFIVWLTGLSGAGKSTLAKALRQRMFSLRPVELLDGDEVRSFLSKELGYTREDRDINVARIGYVARVVARHGVAALVSAISPYAAARRQVRELAEADGIPFFEVYVSAPLDVLVTRDVKGLYKKALAGEIAHFTGVTDPYEPPEAAELEVRTDRQQVQQSLEKILSMLESRGLLRPAPAGTGPE
jgi:sulfate adenylyltransferase